MTDADAADRLIVRLATMFPAAFTIDPASVQPLRVGIFADLRRELGETFTAPQLSRALQKYTGSLVYLKKCKEGVPRIGLDGTPDGKVSVEHARRARAMRNWLELSGRLR
ncbi:MAG TPA: ProQ/FINO family protein [Candidatus Acidoferrales bacterium]|jgi:ProP effector|nr:ProQ/FINO family protein [Candidatus Acidoferrales bacterium]